jgi:hypothetical protein
MPHYCLRAGNKWTIPELITLQREYELLELTVQEIAQRHKRSVCAIVARLESEGLVEPGVLARGDVVNEDASVDSESVEDDDDDYKSGDSDSDSDSDEDDEDVESEKSDVNKLSDRVWNLETSVNEIGGIVKQMMELMSNDRQAKTNSKARLAPLRAQNQHIHF